MKICNKCSASKPNKEFSVNNRFSDNRERICKVCLSIRRKNNYRPDKAKLSWKRNKYSSPEINENRRLIAAYGISKKMRDYMEQQIDGLCEICSVSAKLVVDHDHKTGKVRGLICSKCNRGLGHFDDNIELLTKAFEYLTIRTHTNNIDFK